MTEIQLPLIAGACLFFAFSKVLSANRLNSFFSSSGIILPQLINLKLYWLGMFYNLFLPGGIGGDGYKVYYLKKKLKIPVKKSILALIMDRVTGLFALGIMCVAMSLFVLKGKLHPAIHIALILTATSLFYFIVYRYFTKFYAMLHVTNLQSFGVQLLQMIASALILIAMGNDQQILSYLFLFLISSVVAAIPFTIGGAGARELTFLYASRFLSLDPAVSVSFSLLFFIITATVSLTGSVYAIWPEKISLTAAPYATNRLNT
jgi:uncharacterized membrane protein YbhN (UPF0104 family)